MAFVPPKERDHAITPEGRALILEMPERIGRVRAAIAQRILGQERTVEQVLTCFIAGGHALIVGVPGLAKTLLIRTLGELLDLEFSRIQFTPDLMPSDISGTTLLVRNDATGRREFRFRPGPIFSNLLLADEINRTPPKTQAALLEAMEEYQVTVAGQRHGLTRPFFVLATQNPIEQEGTYPLPITQLDRFQFQIDIDYPAFETEFEVVASTTSTLSTRLDPILDKAQVLQLLSLPRKLVVPDAIVARASRLVRATRPDEGTPCDAARDWISWGAGPRAVQAILNAARARAVMSGRLEVTAEDYEEVLVPALRHRVVLNYHAEAEGVTPDQVLASLRTQIGDARAPVERPAESRSSRLMAWINSWGDPAPRFRRSP
ncbi:MAG: AAA family ATPase [Planctomycetota bacterium]